MSKAKFIVGYFCLSLLLLYSCKEDPPPIDFSITNQSLLDTTYVDSSIILLPQEKHVLVEEATGIACAACPAGHQELKDIQDAYPGKVAVVAIHPTYGAFTDPAGSPDFETDFRTDCGDGIIDLCGGIIGLPSVSIDRVQFANQNDIFINNTEGVWFTKVSEQLGLSTRVNIDIVETTYYSEERFAKVKVKLLYTDSVLDDQYLSVYLLEDNIIAEQEFHNGFVSNYEHRHILRDMFTSNQGDALSVELELGRVFEKEFLLSIDEDWNSDELHVVVAVHHKINKNDVENIRSAHIGH